MLSSSVKKRFFVPAIFVLCILSLNFFPSQIRGFFHLIAAPLESFLWKEGSRTSQFFSSLVGAGSLMQENKLLESENLELRAKLAKLQSAKEENETLRETLALSKTSRFTFVAAPILGKDLRADVLTIRLPQDGKIVTGMPVVTSDKVLIGKVGEVSGSSAKVLLVSHRDSSFDAKIANANTSGVVKGQGRYRLLFDLVQKDAKLSLGDTVVTSSLGGTFPANLLVGEVEEINASDAQPFQQALLVPFWDLPREEFLLVITEF